MASNKKDKRDEDPFKEMIEEMVKNIDKMMRENNTKMNLPQKFTWEKTPNKDMRFSFTFNPSQPQQTREMKNRRMKDVIEKEKEIIITLEMEKPTEEDIKVNLTPNNKVEIRTNNTMQEIPLPNKGEKIKDKTYRNGVLEVKVQKQGE